MKVLPDSTWLNRRSDEGELPKKTLKHFLYEKSRSLSGCEFGLRSKTANAF